MFSCFNLISWLGKVFSLFSLEIHNVVVLVFSFPSIFLFRDRFSVFYLNLLKEVFFFSHLVLLMGNFLRHSSMFLALAVVLLPLTLSVAQEGVFLSFSWLFSGIRSQSYHGLLSGRFHLLSCNAQGLVLLFVLCLVVERVILSLLGLADGRALLSTLVLLREVGLAEGIALLSDLGLAEGRALLSLISLTERKALISLLGLPDGRSLLFISLVLLREELCFSPWSC
jgi:hypothetical protein